MIRHAFGRLILCAAAAALVQLTLLETWTAYASVTGGASSPNEAQPGGWRPNSILLSVISLGSILLAAFAGWRTFTTARLNRQLLKSQEKLAADTLLRTNQAASRALESCENVEETGRSRQFAESFFNQTQSLNMVADFDGKILQLNGAWKDLLGYDLRDPDAFEPSRLVHPEDKATTAEQLKRLASGAKVDGFENRWRCQNGEYKNLRWFARADLGQRLIFALVQEVTEQKAAENALKLNASVYACANEGIFITDPLGRILDINSAFTTITGFGLPDVLDQYASFLSAAGCDGIPNQDHLETVKADGAWRGEVSIRTQEGEPFPALLTLSAVKDVNGEITNYIGLLSDISKLKDHEKALEKLARHDQLTGLPNRDQLADRLAQAMARARRHDLFIAVAFIDLDGFKAVNDTYGHSTGDALLVAIARRLKAALRIEDTLARIGGDEFVAIITDLHHERDCIGTLERILNAASEQVILGSVTTSVTASIGVTFYPQEDVNSGDQLERQADQAMYEAKLAGRNRFRFFDPDKDKALAAYHTQVAEAQTALERAEFRLYYQPKVDLETGLVIGCEALLRWQHPDRGLLLPKDFLPPIRKHPALALSIGNWVLDEALQQLREWQKHGLDLNVSVNLSGLQVMAPEFKDVLRGHLEDHPSISPEHLEIEFVEADVLLDLNTMETVLESCQGLGVRFALDDFGTGYSSLTCLKHLPINTLKIHQGLVMGSLACRRDQEILKTIISMGQVFKLDILAEGVETAAHANWLRNNGCRYGQGNVFAEPMPAQDIPDWYSRQINSSFAGLSSPEQTAAS